MRGLQPGDRITNLAGIEGEDMFLTVLAKEGDALELSSPSNTPNCVRIASGPFVWDGNALRDEDNDALSLFSPEWQVSKGEGMEEVEAYEVLLELVDTYNTLAQKERRHLLEQHSKEVMVISALILDAKMNYMGTAGRIRVLLDPFDSSIQDSLWSFALRLAQSFGEHQEHRDITKNLAMLIKSDLNFFEYKKNNEDQDNTDQGGAEGKTLH